MRTHVRLSAYVRMFTINSLSVQGGGSEKSVNHENCAGGAGLRQFSWSCVEQPTLLSIVQLKAGGFGAAEGEVHILYRCAAGTFAKVVEAGDEQDALVIAVD